MGRTESGRVTLMDSKSRAHKQKSPTKDSTRNQRTRQREEKIKLACLKFGFKNKSELLTALVNNQVQIQRSNMNDMGIIDGKRVYYGGGKSLVELIDSGEVIAIPDNEDGVTFKRKERVTALEKLAAYSPEEIRKMAREQGQDL